jgi:hypothetical protein
VTDVTDFGGAMALAFSTQHSAILTGGCLMKDFRNLLVWEKAHLLALASYRGTEMFPK